MKKTIFAMAFFTLATQANAGTTRVIQADSVNATGGASLAVPSTGSNLVSDSATQTLTNKTISGASNTLSSIPASAVSSGQIGVANGGTGASTLTANGILQGNGTSAVSAVTGSQYQSLTFGSGGVPQAGSVPLNQSAAVSGQLPVANGGTGSSSLTSGGVLVGAGTSAPTAVTCSNSNYVLAWSGSAWSCVPQSAGGGTTNVVGSASSPQSVVATAGISVLGQITNGPNLVFVSGSGGAVTVTATPSITACTAAGELLTLIGESATNTVTLQDNAGLSGSKLQLNGNITLGLYSSISFYCDAASGNWVEIARR